jgi:DNA-binding MarR family transcriptional regulator
MTTGPADLARAPVAAAAGRVAPDRAEDEVAARLRLAVTRLHRRLRQQGAGDLTQSQASALASIERLGSPTLGALAARESVRPPSMTRIVGALEELGYVSRVTDSNDRRVARVTLSTEGQRILEHNRSAKNAFLAQQLHRLEPGERLALADLTNLLERLLAADEVDGADEVDEADGADGVDGVAVGDDGVEGDR